MITEFFNISKTCNSPHKQDAPLCSFLLLFCTTGTQTIFCKLFSFYLILFWTKLKCMLRLQNGTKKKKFSWSETWTCDLLIEIPGRNLSVTSIVVTCNNWFVHWFSIFAQNSLLHTNKMLFKVLFFYTLQSFGFYCFVSHKKYCIHYFVSILFYFGRNLAG